MTGHMDRVIADLLETDALTARREPSDGVYIVHEDDLEHLVRNVIDIDHDLSAAEKSPTWADVVVMSRTRSHSGTSTPTASWLARNGTPATTTRKRGSHALQDRNLSVRACTLSRR